MSSRTLRATFAARDCPANASFAYVGNSDGILNPYLTMAKRYGWATSAPIQDDDHASYFVSETPAMAAGVTSKLWEMSDMVKVLEGLEAVE